MSNFNEDIFNESDDDLFQDTTDVSNNIAEHLKEHHGIDVDITDIDIDNPDSNIVRAKIYIALNQASGSWVSNAHSAAFTRSAQQSIDELTGGHYSKLNYYYTIEGRIIQRRVIIELLKAMKDIDSDDIKFIRDTFKINTDYVFTEVYINSLQNILQYLNDRYLKIYLALAQDLNLEPEPTIAEEIIELPYLQRFHAQASYRKYVTPEYIANALSKFTEN